MKQVFDHRVYVSVNGGHLYDTSMWERLHYEEPQPPVERTFTSFADLFEFVKEGNLRNAEVGYTLFRKRPYIHLSVADLHKECYYLFEKSFKSVRIVSVCEPLSRNTTYKYLSNNLPAEQFVEWLNDTKAKLGE